MKNYQLEALRAMSTATSTYSPDVAAARAQVVASMFARQVQLEEDRHGHLA